MHDRIARSFWIDRAPKRAPRPSLRGNQHTDLLIIGGGYTGLWSALLAAEREPGRRITLLEGGTIGHAASGRNGGFVEPSISHGIGNALERWPEQASEIARLSDENFEGMRADVARHGIACDWTEAGNLTFARTQWQADALEEFAPEATAHGEPTTFIGPDRIGEFTKSPAYVAATHTSAGATVDPYKLALGLLDAVLAAGVEVHEHSIVRRLDHASELRAHTERGSIRAKQVVLATNAYPPLLRRLAGVTVPVYDYALMTEPLSEEQFERIGWTGQEGLSDAGNQFHYYRKTDDGRILWGGYDAVYYFGSRRSESLTQRAETFATLERNFFATYPQLEGVRFTHQWGGMIDTSTQFCVTSDVVSRGRIAYAVGFTGLGVAATRFGAQVMLDQLAGEQTDRLALDLVRKHPLRFPPEPARALGVNLSRWSMAREDATGRRNLWLRTMDAVGLGFDS
jgi:glycine/D-amino acid oxidase-like deaminating enzyme